MRTMSAASIATFVPDERAIPTVAATRAGESLMPSPTYKIHYEFTLFYLKM